MKKNLASIRVGVIAICMLAIGMVSTSHAAIIYQGDTNSTLDTDTNLEWLHVSLTSYTSYNNAKVLGEALGGYRHATLSEVTTLWTNAGITDIGGSLSRSNFLPVRYLMGDLGGNTNLNAWPEYILAGWIDNGSSGASASFAQLRYLYDGPGSAEGRGQAYFSSTTYSPDESSGLYGNYLVRASVVPVPAAVWLFGSALFGLIAVKRRKA